MGSAGDGGGCEGFKKEASGKTKKNEQKGSAAGT